MRFLKILLFFLITCGSSYSQKKFTLKIEAPEFYGDSLLFSAPIIKVGLEELYKFNIEVNSEINRFGRMAGKSNSVYQVRITPKTLIEGDFSYPQPVSLQYYDRETRQVFVSSRFFLDSGIYNIFIPRNFDYYQIKIQSPVNDEYSRFKTLFSDLYTLDSGNLKKYTLLNLDEKQLRISSYIKENPGSFVAFWEIVNDYTLYGYNFYYLINLDLFSNDVKNCQAFSLLKSRLIAENTTLKGDEFPSVYLNKKTKFDKEYFKKYKLTFIDFWSITCTPCIKSMPEILSLYTNYTKKGVNFISITAENNLNYGNVAKRILTRVNAAWINYFDESRDFSRKLGVTAYPLYLLVDQNGFIVEKTYGDLATISKYLSEKIK